MDKERDMSNMQCKKDKKEKEDFKIELNNGYIEKSKLIETITMVSKIRNVNSFNMIQGFVTSIYKEESAGK